MGEGAADEGASPRAKPSPSRRRGKKAPPRNIFLEFGMDSNDQAMTEVEIGGVVVKRFNFKKFWQSDTDLRRWQGGLHDRTRFGGLLKKELMRYNPDFHAEQSLLQTEHNSLRRQRDRTDDVDLKPMAAQELRELRQRLEPKEVKKPQKKTDFSDLLKGGGGAAAGGLSLGLSLGGKPPPEGAPAVDEAQAAAALDRLLDFLATRFGSLEAAFASIDVDGSGEVSVSEFAVACTNMGYRSDVSCLMTVLDKDRSGNLTLAEFLRLKPFLDQHRARSPLPSSRCDGEPPWTSQGLERGVSDASGSKVSIGRPISSGLGDSAPSAPPRARPRPPPPAVKSGATLLIFRNAIHGHCGDAVYLRQWPPPSMESVLKSAEKVCKLLIGPATKLYDSSLRPIKSVDQVQPGGAYLLKGQEALDPPPRFLHHRASGETSLRALMRAGNAATVEVEDARKPPKEVSVAEPPQGSPPWQSRSQPLPSQGAKWQVDEKVGLLLLNAGLGQRHQFHHFDTWERALPARRSIDRRSMSTTF